MFSDSDSEKEVITAVLRGDTERFGLLVERHGQKVFSLCLSLLGNTAEAEDAAQNAFVKAYKSLISFRSDCSFPTWLHRIAYNCCMDALKLRSKTLQMPENFADTIAEPEKPVAHEDLELLKKAFAELPDDYRSILLMVEAERLSYEEIAEITGGSLDAVKSRIARARRRLEENARHFLERMQSNSGRAL